MGETLLGVHSLDHAALSVPDLAAAKTFYTAFGLDVREEKGALGLYTFGHPHRWVTITGGASKKKLRYVSFGAYAKDMSGLEQQIRGAGAEIIAAPEGANKEGIWFKNPDGLPFHVTVADKSSPDEKAKVKFSSAGPGVAGIYGRSKAPVVKPRRLAHVLIFATDVLGSIEFYSKTLGLRLSDRSADIVAFMHGPHGSDHHMLAMAKSDGPGLHHISWDVGSVDDVGLGAAQMAAQGYDYGWGFGRHVLGSNYFHYVRDPWGSYSEYSADIDYIPAGHDWPAADHDPGDSMFLWGPNPPEDFITNFESR